MLEAICFQTRDVLLAMKQDADMSALKALFVDGGASQNDTLMQARGALPLCTLPCTLMQAGGALLLCALPCTQRSAPWVLGCFNALKLGSGCRRAPLVLA